jgi:phage recombination protein Bet
MSNLVEYKSGETTVQLSPQIIKNYLVSGGGNVSDQEVYMFLNLCHSQRLNPFLREAYLIKYGDRPATMVVGKDVFTKRAAKNPNFAGYEAGIIIQNDKGVEHRVGSLVLDGEKLVGGWAKVFLRDYAVPIEDTVSMTEYCQMKDGRPSGTWAKMPATMIRKVAICHALREAFPEDLQGLYDSSEMPVFESDMSQKPIPTDSVKVYDENGHEIPQGADKIISEAQGKRMYAMSKGNADLCKEIIGIFGYESSKEVLVSDYDEICNMIQEAVENSSGEG